MVFVLPLNPSGIPHPSTPHSVASSPQEDMILAHTLVQQLQQHQGCSSEMHSAVEPSSTPTVSLSEMASWACPDVLGQPSITKYPTLWDTNMPIDQCQRLYCGFSSAAQQNADSQEPPPSPATVDIERDAIPIPMGMHVSFDIDSAGGLASDLAVAHQGFYWKAGWSLTSNLQSSLHLDPVPVQWTDEQSRRLCETCSPVHKIPHLPFGRLAGFHEVEIYILFPQLFYPHCKYEIITADEYDLWTDQVFLPALHSAYPARAIQHMPSNAAHIHCNSTAARVESQNQMQHQQPCTQEFHYLLQSDGLSSLWQNIQTRIQDQGLQQYQDVLLLLTLKNLKLLTQCPTWSRMHSAFFYMWNKAVDGQYLTSSFFDIGKEIITPWSFMLHETPVCQPCTSIWWRCCLDQFCNWLANSSAAKGTTPSSSSENQTEDELDMDGEDEVHDHTLTQLCWSNQLHTQMQPSDSSQLDTNNINYAELEMSSKGGHEDINEYELDNHGHIGDNNNLQDDTAHSSADDASDSDSAASDSDSNSSIDQVQCTEQQSKEPWKKEFYPLSLLQDLGSMTLETHCHSPL